MADPDNEHENQNDPSGEDADFLQDGLDTDSQLDELTSFASEDLADFGSASGDALVDDLLGAPLDPIDEPAAEAEPPPLPSDESLLSEELPEPEFEGTPIPQEPRRARRDEPSSFVENGLSGSVELPPEPTPIADDPEPQPASDPAPDEADEQGRQ